MTRAACHLTKTSKSPAEDARKATKPVVKPTPKTPRAPADPKTAAPAETWRTAPADKKAPKPLTAFQRWLADGEGKGVDPFDEFIAFVLGGGHMADFCKAREIPYTTMYDWVRADDRRAEMYARAREDRAEKFADEIVAIADETECAPVVDRATGQTVAMAFDKTAVARNKLRVDARKWIAAKLKPRVYGDKVQVEGSVDHRVLTDEALLKRLAQFGVALPAIVPQAPKEGGDAA